MKSKNIAIWLNINPIGATGKSIIMNKNQYLFHSSHIKPAEILEQWLEKKIIKSREPCSLFTNGQLEIEKIQKSEVTQLISSY